MKNVNKGKRWYRKEPIGEFWDRKEAERAQQKIHSRTEKNNQLHTDTEEVHAFLL